MYFYINIRRYGPFWALPLHILSDQIIDPFVAFKILTLFSGLVLIFLAYILGRMLMNERAGLVSAGFTAASYMLIDYSASGSIYMLHGAFYLLWLIVVMRCYDGGTAEFISKKFFSNWQIFYLAVISAIGFMLNYQAVTLALASIVIILFLSNASWRMRIKKVLFFIAIFFVFISPLMIRNYLAFGSPFFCPEATTYIFQKAGLPYVVNEGIEIRIKPPFN